MHSVKIIEIEKFKFMPNNNMLRFFKYRMNSQEKISSLKWAPVNEGSDLMWTFARERNLFYYCISQSIVRLGQPMNHQK